MGITQHEAHAAGRPAHDRGLLMLVGGAIVLIVVGLISIPVAMNRTPTIAPAGTPEGVVQRFYQAAYGGDYQTAYTFLSADTQRAVSVVAFQQQMGWEVQNSQMRVTSSTTHDSSATVRVTVTHVEPSGIFGSGEWQNNVEVVLRREGDAWKIVSGPFSVPYMP
jgi:hypothetical protein